MSRTPTVTCSDCGATVAEINATTVSRVRWGTANVLDEHKLCPDCAKLDFVENMADAAKRLREDR